MKKKRRGKFPKKAENPGVEGIGENVDNVDNMWKKVMQTTTESLVGP